jgi:hypothetical protein
MIGSTEGAALNPGRNLLGTRAETPDGTPPDPLRITQSTEILMALIASR